MWNTNDYPAIKAAFAALVISSPGPDLFDLEEAQIATREEYLAFVKAWKSAWHDLVAQIRKQKKLRRTAADSEARSLAQSRREVLRHRASGMMVLRHAARDASRKRRARVSRAA